MSQFFNKLVYSNFSNFSIEQIWKFWEDPSIRCQLNVAEKIHVKSQFFNKFVYSNVFEEIFQLIWKFCREDPSIRCQLNIVCDGEMNHSPIIHYRIIFEKLQLHT